MDSAAKAKFKFMLLIVVRTLLLRGGAFDLVRDLGDDDVLFIVIFF